MPHIVLSYPPLHVSGVRTPPEAPSARGPEVWPPKDHGGDACHSAALNLVARKLNPVSPQPCGLSLWILEARVLTLCCFIFIY